MTTRGLNAEAVQETEHRRVEMRTAQGNDGLNYRL